MLGIASRMMEGGRKDFLDGCDTLVRSFDPPEEFSYMASFNAELDTELDRLHPKSRELINQSLSLAQEKTGAAFAAPV